MDVCLPTRGRGFFCRPVGLRDLEFRVQMYIYLGSPILSFRVSLFLYQGLDFGIRGPSELKILSSLEFFHS